MNKASTNPRSKRTSCQNATFWSKQTLTH